MMSFQKYKNGKIVEEDDKEMEVVKAEEPVPRLDAVGLAIGAKLIASKKTKRQLMDESYNRFVSTPTLLLVWWSREGGVTEIMIICNGYYIR